jgi:hypothetical protein
MKLIQKYFYLTKFPLISPPGNAAECKLTCIEMTLRSASYCQGGTRVRYW